MGRVTFSSAVMATMLGIAVAGPSCGTESADPTPSSGGHAGVSAGSGGSAAGSSGSGGSTSTGVSGASGGTGGAGTGGAGTGGAGGSPSMNETGGAAGDGNSGSSGTGGSGGVPTDSGGASTGGSSGASGSGVLEGGAAPHDAANIVVDSGARDASAPPKQDAAPVDPTQKITVWMAGDSTMADPSGTCPVGWGSKFQAQFNGNAKVVNNAVSGTTVRSWLYDVTSTLGSNGDCTLGSTALQSRWTQIANGMKAGDYLFIQFGINDTTSASCPKHVSYDTFKQLFGMMATAAKDKGAQPIFLTAVSSISCMGSMAQGTRGGFANATKEAGMQYNVPVIDLEQLSVALYTSLGFCPSTDSTATFSASTPIGRFFCNDHTHFEAEGATQIATIVAKAVKDQGFGLAAYLAK